MESDDVGTHVDLSVVRRHDEPGPRGQRLQEITDQAIGRLDLGVVQISKAVLVGHLVDAVVVRVHE